MPVSNLTRRSSPVNSVAVLSMGPQPPISIPEKGNMPLPLAMPRRLAGKQPGACCSSGDRVILLKVGGSSILLGPWSATAVGNDGHLKVLRETYNVLGEILAT